MIEPLKLRTSCLIARAHLIAHGFDDLGCKFSAEFTRDLARSVEAGMPAALYEHWIEQQAALLAEKQRNVA